MIQVVYYTFAHNKKMYCTRAQFNYCFDLASVLSISLAVKAIQKDMAVDSERNVAWTSCPISEQLP